MTREELEEIAAKLVGFPVYILTTSDGFHFGSERTGGMFASYLDMLAQEQLRAAGRWDGRRLTLFVDDMDCEGRFSLLATLCHELGHYGEHGFPHEQAAEDVPVHEVEQSRQSIAAKATKTADPVEYDPHHSSKFVRAAVHYWQRLQWQRPDLWFPCGLLWQAEWYGGLPTPLKVLTALGDEPRRLLPLFVPTIVELPAPAAFDELFAR